jgi:REP element-mobilizing transposase RayT
MARPLRLEYHGALYHLTARGDRQEPIYEDDGDYLAFIDLLAKEVMQQAWVLYAFCLMGNHYHLLLETPEPNLVKGMRRLNGVYTQAFNRRHHRVGHVLQGRYKSILVDKETHLLELCRYVVLNPVRARIVASVQDWRWSSYLATCATAGCPEWLAADRVLELFGNSASRARRAYARFVAAGVNQPSPWSELKGQIFLGSDAFHNTMQARLRGKKPKGVSRRQLEPGRPSPQAVVRTLARAYGLKPSELLDRGSGPPFQHAVYLLRRRANLSLQEVAQLAHVSIGRIAQIQSKIESSELDPLLRQIMAEL